MKVELVLAAMLVVGSTVSGQVKPPFPKNLSERALRVLMVTRREAGLRGASSITVNDLITGLIIEDQDPDLKILLQGLPPTSYLPQRLVKERSSFFSATIATDMLTALKEILPQAASVPDNTEIPASPEFERVLIAAAALPSELHQTEVPVRGRRIQAAVPLDLLVAILREPCEGTTMLQAAGITEEKVLEIVRGGQDLENWPPPNTP